MNAAQIIALVMALAQLAPLIPVFLEWAQGQILADENLTAEEKAEFIQRIKDAQGIVPEWK